MEARLVGRLVGGWTGPGGTGGGHGGSMGGVHDGVDSCRHARGWNATKENKYNFSKVNFIVTL